MSKKETIIKISDETAKSDRLEVKSDKFTVVVYPENHQFQAQEIADAFNRAFKLHNSLLRMEVEPIKTITNLK